MVVQYTLVGPCDLPDDGIPDAIAKLTNKNGIYR